MPKNIPVTRLGRILKRLREVPENHPVVFPLAVGAVPGLVGGGAIAAYQNANSEAPSLSADAEMELPTYVEEKSAGLSVGNAIGGLGGLVLGHQAMDYAVTKDNEEEVRARVEALKQRFRDTLIAEQQLAANRYATPLPTVSAPAAEAVAEKAAADAVPVLVEYFRRTKAASGLGDAMNYPLTKLWKKVTGRISDLGRGVEEGAGKAKGKGKTESEYNPIPVAVASIAGLGGLGAGFTEAYRRTSEGDENRALLASIKQDVKNRIGATGRIPIMIVNDAGPSLQPIGQGAKALVDPNRGSDVLSIV